jgi:hypothetical protein
MILLETIICAGGHMTGMIETIIAGLPAFRNGISGCWTAIG